MDELAPVGTQVDGRGAVDDVRPLTSIRRVVVRRMSEAWRSVPAVTLHRRVAFRQLLDARERLAEATGRKPLIDALLANRVAHALSEWELLNGSWLESERAVKVHSRRNVAVAVDAPQGLTAVVLHDADQRSPARLTEELAAMIERARAGRSKPDDLAAPTFTITNLGGLGIDWFNPIVTPPQAAVLGVGAIRMEPTFECPCILSLTFDHRVVDGSYAARFLGSLAEAIATAGDP